MKIFKKIVSATMAIAMIASITTIASAANLDSFKQNDYLVYVNKSTIEQGTTTFTAEVGLKDITGEVIDIPQETTGSSSFYASLSDDAQAAGIKFVDITSTIASISNLDTDNETYFGCTITFDKSDVQLSETTPILTATFSAPADIAVGTYNLFFDEGAGDCLLLIDKNNNTSTEQICDPTPIVTVTAPAASDPITATTAANGATVLEYAADYDGDKDLEGKYIVMRETTAPAGSLTAASRVVVTYEDNENPSLNKVVEYGKTLFEFLGLTGDGAVNTKAIKFGIVYEDANYKAANFTFTIK